MKVSLFHNEDAGDGVPFPTIREMIERAGHVIVDSESAADVLVAAGGDGTVAEAVRFVRGRNLPLAILSLGTANNIAESLGLATSVEQAIDRWNTAERRPFDLGRIDGVAGYREFIEGVGTGLIPCGMRSALAHPIRGADVEAKLVNAVTRYRDVLANLEPTPWTVILDGRSVVGDFLVIEILNVRAIGPNLVFSLDATPSDGFLTVVMAADEHRERLADYLDAASRGEESHLSLPAQHAQRIEIQGKGEMHIDDEVVNVDGSVTFGIEPAVVEFLV